MTSTLCACTEMRVAKVQAWQSMLPQTAAMLGSPGLKPRGCVTSAPADMEEF